MQQPESSSPAVPPAANPDTESTTAQSDFSSLGLPEPIVAAVSAIGYETPSPIQAQTIPLLLAGRDVMGLAQTGTGKTAAYALPLLAAIDTRQAVPQALVLAPTRELALQVCEALEQFASHLPGLRVVPLYGGQGYGPQLGALRRGVHVVVGTPGRLIDHLRKKTLDLSAVKHVVLDEADEMLTMGFAEEVDSILAAVPDPHQTALFSATMPSSIRRIASRHLQDPAEVSVKSSTATATNVEQRVLEVAWRDKLDALTRVLEVEQYEAVIVFVRTKRDTEELAEKLRARGVEAAAINGDVPQNQREQLVERLRDGALDLLVATDVAARGLDVPRITHVINYDVPTDPEAYVHRVGRTGRAGRSGVAITFATPRERRLVSQIERTSRQRMTNISLPSAGEVNDARLERFDAAIGAALERGNELAEMRGVIEHYVSHHDVPEVDVAAALALVSQGGKPLLLDDTPAATSTSTHQRRDGARGRDGQRGGRGRRDEHHRRHDDEHGDTKRRTHGERDHDRDRPSRGAGKTVTPRRDGHHTDGRDTVDGGPKRKDRWRKRPGGGPKGKGKGRGQGGGKPSR